MKQTKDIDVKLKKIKDEIKNYKWSYEKIKKGYNLIYHELEQKNEKLGESELKFRRLFETAQDAILILNPHSGKIEDANPFIKELLEYPAEELIGKQLWEISPFKNIAANKEKFIELQKKGYVRYENLPLETKSGEKRYVEFVSNVYEIDGKKVVQCNIRDITERKRIADELKKAKENVDKIVEERTMELKESNERFIVLYNSSKDAIMTLEPPSWKFTAGNPATLKMFNTPDEKTFASLGPWNLSPEKQPDGQLSSVKAKKMIEKTMKKGSNYFEWTHIKYKGKEFPATVLLSRVKEKGKTYLQATVRNITEQKNAEKKLEQAKKRYETLFGSAVDAIFIADSRTRQIVDCNKAAEKLIGYSRDKILSMKADELHPKDRVKETMEGFEEQAKARAEGKNKIVFTEVITKDNKRIPVSINVAVINFEDKNYLQGIFRDITEQKNAEDKMKEAYEKLKEADAIKSKFLTITSHELKTPLTPAKIQTQMLLQGDLGKLTEQQQKSFEIILRNINRLSKLIEDILEISRVEAEGFKLSLEKAKITDIIKSVIKNMDPMAKNKGLRAIKYTSTDLPELMLDKQRITEVFVNLIDNAIKFTDKGGVSIKAEKVKGNVLVKITDSGRGISKENFDKIFQPFFQTEPVFTRKHGGTGLGLSICKGIIEKHGGKIWFESELNKGTTFYFTLPIKSDVE